jgi:single-strand DNA-binding protein
LPKGGIVAGGLDSIQKASHFFILNFIIMNTLRNSVQLIGHLGADPEVKNISNGSKVATMRIATTERYQSNGEWKEDTQWHRLAMWEQLAERAQNNLRKGSFVMVEGKLTHRKYTDVQGKLRFATEVRVVQFIHMDRKPSTQAMHS